MGKKLERDIDWLIKYYQDFFTQYGLDEASIKGEYQRYKDEVPSITIIEFMNNIFQLLLSRLLQQTSDRQQYLKDLFDILSLHFFFKQKEEKVYDAELVKHIEKVRVQQYFIDLPFLFMVQICSNACCPECLLFHEKKYTPSDALDYDLIPIPSCTRTKGCNCRLTAVAMRTSDDSLIL